MPERCPQSQHGQVVQHEPRLLESLFLQDNKKWWLHFFMVMLMSMHTQEVIESPWQHEANDKFGNAFTFLAVY